MASDGTRLDRTCATPGCEAPRDAGLTLRLLVLLPWLSMSMRASGFRRTYRRLERRTRSRVAGGPVDVNPVDHLTALVIHVNRHVLPYQSKCLLESLVLWYLLRRRGFDADLLLGARTLLGPLEAHAWVELDGRVLNDDANVRDIYEPFDLASLETRTESM